MTDTAMVSMWSTLVPVMVGGAIGLVGGWLGPMLVERRKEVAEKKKKRAEKFEELVTALYEHKHWLDTMENIRVFGSEEKPPVSPFARVQAISNVYFSEFETQVEELKKLASEYEAWMSTRGVIPTAPNIDSLRDSQIRESLTRCWLLKEEQHRWVQRLRSDGLI